ncbi:MAG: rhomboid family intramembrane serine protease [Opitutaceae bacterium]|nr:rhomboid family intramembrane serine protease [Opitutaceae bacterium]
MLSDRSYMRDDYEASRTSVLVWLVCALVAGFLLHVLFDRALNTTAFASLTELSSRGLREWKVWTLLTHPFVDNGIFSVLFNCLSIYFLGRELLPLVGEKRFLGLIAACAIFAGLSWFAVNHDRAGVLNGATSISCGLLILYACINPNREITLLLFFILPVTVKPKYLGWIVGGIALLGMVAGEIPGGSYATGIPHSAHVGGIIAALLYFLLVHQREWLNADSRPSIQLPAWFQKKKSSAQTTTPNYKVNLTNRADLRAEVDRILDKINSEGFGALTAEEKKILDDARDSLSRR